MLLGLIYILLLVGIYFFPSIVALSRKHANFTAIFVLNLFLGLTFFGWVFALIWAVYNSPASQQSSNKRK